MIDVRTVYYYKYLESCRTMCIIPPRATCNTATGINRMDRINKTTVHVLGPVASFLT